MTYQRPGQVSREGDASTLDLGEGSPNMVVDSNYG